MEYLRFSSTQRAGSHCLVEERNALLEKLTSNSDCGTLLIARKDWEGKHKIEEERK